MILPLLLMAAVTAVAGSVIPFPGDRASSVAVIVRDLSDGKDIVSQNPYKAMIPASTMKCVTSAAALLAGLDNERFTTDVFTRGEISDGVLYGDLIIQGAGDPTIESAQFPSNPGLVSEIVSKVKASGIRFIKGMIIVDESRFPDNGPCRRWELSDTEYEYGAGLYGLNYRDNRVGDKAMANPFEAFGEALENRLLANGVEVGWDVIEFESDAPYVKLLTHTSPRGDEILRNLMCRSDNLFAEGMLRRLAPGQSLKSAISKERSLLAAKGLEFDITDIYDGSGLSRNNRVTADFMADLLELMARETGVNSSYVSLFPEAGKEGTVKSLLKGKRIDGRLVLKSGSMNGVHCYAGYHLDEEGNPDRAVVILVNDFFCKRGAVRESISDFLHNQFKSVK